MSRKVPEVIFRAKAIDGKIIFENNEHLNYYCIEHDSEYLFVHIEPEAQVSEKMAMYAYLHRVIYPCAVLGYTGAGYEGIDAVKVDYLLRGEFAKDFIKKPNGEYQVIILDKRNMTKARLYKYISDCIFFIETELKQRVPDSGEYINKVIAKNNLKNN